MILGGAGELGREEARRLAREELSRKAYSDARPPLLVRLATRVLRAVADAFDRAAGAVPAGRAGLVLLMLLVAGLVALLLVRLRPARSASGMPLFSGGQPLDAEAHRRRADELAAGGQWAEAVRERLRALVRELELRGVLDRRPGRAAGEIATEAGTQVPALADGLRRAATVFNEVWYGGRSADERSYAVLVEVDRQVREAQPVPA